MKGQILDYSIQQNEGVISAADGSRHKFLGSEWKGGTPPSCGMLVDFDVQADQTVGVYQALGEVATAKTGTKSKAAVTLWGAFLGGFGAHKFYIGSWGWGIVYLLTCWLYIPFIAATVEWIRIVLMSDDEFYTKLAEFQSKKPGPFGFFW